jgi:glycosyltransferase involved in cell wall biosynthesis
MSLPLVSVVIPVYNGELFLTEAVDSIRWQNYEPLEIVIVDDGSTDRTVQIIENLGKDIRFISQANQGPGAARNRALEVARGELIAFLDADDQWPRGKLHLQVRYLLDHPEHDLVTGLIRLVTMPGANNRFRSIVPDDTMSHINLGAAVCRRRLFDQVGLFDESFRMSEDQDWFLRVREHKVPIIILEDITLFYRLHDNNMTHDCKPSDYLLTRLFKQSLERRRRQNQGKAQELGGWRERDHKHIAEAAAVPKGPVTNSSKCR